MNSLNRLDLSNITVNGQPLAVVIAEQTKQEINQQQRDMQKSIAFLVAHSRSRSGYKTRNHSGARSGRGRVIFSVGGVA